MNVKTPVPTLSLKSVSTIKIWLFACAVFCSASLFAQKQKEDSLRTLLAKEKIDSNRVTLMWRLADVTNRHSPDSALRMAQDALFLARRIKYLEGESRSLGIIGNTLLKLGNYPKALDYYFQKLKIEESRNQPRNLSSVIINIGIVYLFQEEYRTALSYYLKADSLIEQNNLTDIKYNSALNIGDLYDRMYVNDSAFMYYNKSLNLAKQMHDTGFIGTSMLGLGHNALKKKSYAAATDFYFTSIPYLEQSKDEDLLCEVNLGLAKLYNETGKNDSAIFFARRSFDMGKADGFLSRELDAAQLLKVLYKNAKNLDSAYVFQEQNILLGDSINSRDRIRQLQLLATNEQVRQREIEETKRKAKEERSQQLQYLFISVFIPLIFLMTFFLSKKRIHARFVKFMGIISLLILFEFLTLLLHPVVAQITNHNPIYELLVFVCIASLLIPTHHRIERWIIEKLTHRKADSISTEYV